MSADVTPRPEITNAKKSPFEVPRSNENTRVVHFLEDGITVASRVWYRGQSFYVDEDSPQFGEMPKIGDRVWLDLTEDEQIEIYGKVMFRPGPWPHKNWDEVDWDEEYSKIDPNDLEAVRRYEKRKKKAEASRPPMGAVRGPGTT